MLHHQFFILLFLANLVLFCKIRTNINFTHMKKIIILFLFLTSTAFGQVSFNKNGVADTRPRLFVFTNATIVVDASTTIEKASMIVRNDIIEAVGKDLKIPKGAVVYDLAGKRIYPSFIDLYSDYGMPEVKRAAGRGFGGSQQIETNTKGAFATNQALKPETDATMLFVADSKKAEEMRKLGFGAALVHSMDGIVRGSGAFVNFADGKENELIIKGKVSSHFSLDKGSSTQYTPVSKMGSVSLLRQAYLDMDWYANGGSLKEKNLSLEALAAQKSLVQIYESDDKLGILRGANIAKEFGINYVFKASGDEYQRIDEIKATGSSLIIPLVFPTAYDVEDPFDAEYVTLGEMKHWEMAPSNAGLLAKSGINFALTTSGLKSKADFIANLRKAIENGLTESKALEALTTIPAKILKLDDKLGTLTAGKLANFIITSDNVFGKTNTIYENWIGGKRYAFADLTTTDIRGVYNLKIDGTDDSKLTINGTVEKPEYAVLLKDSTKITPKFTRNGDLFTLVLKTEKKAISDTRLSGYFTNKNFGGEGQSAEGKAIKWSALFVEANKPEVIKPDTSKAKAIENGKILFPFGAFGATEKPKSENILVKNATVWTNEKEGVIQNTDVLLQNGKIASIGKNLKIPANTKEIDGTGKHLTNGIFDEHSHIALYSINDVQTVSAEVRMNDVINSEDINIYRQLAGGVTSSQLLHGSANCIGGQSAVIKLKWGEAPENLKMPNVDGFIKFALGENVKQGNNNSNSTRYPITRMGVEQVFYDAFYRAKEYEKAWKEYNALKNKTGVAQPRKELELDALVEILNAKRFITCHSYVQSEINMLMKVADSLGFKINTFTHIMEGYKVADKMQKHGASASTFSDWWAYKMEVKEAIPYNAAILTKVGVTTAINSDDAEMARRLNQEAAKTILYGNMSEEEAWKMVTLNPAKMMHLDYKLGSMKAGKDADVVLWNNNPLSIYAKPLYTIIDGAIYFSEENDAKLQEANKKERNRLTQKLLQEKSGGSPTQKVNPKKASERHCDTIVEEEEGE
jgi:imidazolonepropionase-like amidohydrolase